MRNETQKLLDLLIAYLNDVTSLSQKFAADFHEIDRECAVEDPSISLALKELSEAAARFTSRQSDKEIWPGFITNSDLLEVAQSAQNQLDEPKRI